MVLAARGRLSMTAARGHVTAAEQTPKPLLLTAADGPWNWPATHYELIAGAPSDLHVTTVCSAVLRDMHSLGVLTATAEGGDGATAYCFEGDEPLRLASTSFDKAGVGHRVWSSALALALFSRSKAAPTLPANPSVLEIGAGVGLPGLHFGQRMKGQARVTLTDSRPALLALLRQNVARLQLGRDATSDGPAGWMEVRRLEWGSGGRLRDGVFFQENSEGSADRNDTHPPDCASGSPSDRDSAEREGGSRREGAAHYDLVLGSDVCYLPEDVPALTKLLLDLRAPVSLLIAPLSRPSLVDLRDALSAARGVHVEEVLLTLACRKADATPGGGDRSCSIHRLLLVRQPRAV